MIKEETHEKEKNAARGKTILFSGPSAVGKTAALRAVLPLLRAGGGRPCVCKIDCLQSADEALYREIGVPCVTGLSGDLCPDHFLVSNLSELWAWMQEQNGRERLVAAVDEPERNGQECPTAAGDGQERNGQECPAAANDEQGRNVQARPTAASDKQVWNGQERLAAAADERPRAQNILVIETAGLCHRCSPATERMTAGCVLDCTSSCRAPEQMGPMLTEADFAVLTKIDMVSQAELEIVSAAIRTCNPSIELFPLDGLSGYGADALAQWLLERPDGGGMEGDRLRHTMPSGVCSYCVGETRVGAAFQQGVVGKIF